MTAKLPTVSYLTVFDKYILSALLFLVILCVWHALIGSRLFLFPDPIKRISIDFMALYTIAAIYVAFHTAYIPYFLSKLMRHKQVEKEAEQEEREKELSKLKEEQMLTEVKPLVNEVAMNSKASKTAPNARVNFSPQMNNQIQSRQPVNNPMQMRANLNPNSPGQANRLGNSPQQMRTNVNNSPNTPAQAQNARMNSRKSVA